MNGNTGAGVWRHSRLIAALETRALEYSFNYRRGRPVAGHG